MMKASTLGHNGIGWPATNTSGRITSRTNCAMAIRPNTTLATRNPVTCEFTLSANLLDPVKLKVTARAKPAIEIGVLE